MARKGLVAVWRDAIRDSDLRSVPKSVAFVLSTYMNGHGHGWPSRRTLAAGASLTTRAVEKAIAELERAGFLEVDRGRGRATNSYIATLPEEANQVRHKEWLVANESDRSGERHARSGEPRSPESIESVESGALDAAAALNGGAGRALPYEECARCGEVAELVVADIYCSDECRQAARLAAQPEREDEACLSG